MTDKMTPQQRHRCMASIKGKNTKPELMVRRHLHAHGYRYRINVRTLPGSPDIVLRKYNAVIFINGCFWHGHQGCKSYSTPRSNTEYWTTKIERNKARDANNAIKLRRDGWHVIEIWECQLKKAHREQTLNQLIATLEYLKPKQAIATYRRANETMLIAAENDMKYTP